MEEIEIENRSFREEINELKGEITKLKQTMNGYKQEVEDVFERKVEENVREICSAIRDEQRKMIVEIYRENMKETIEEAKKALMKEVVEVCSTTIQDEQKKMIIEIYRENMRETTEEARKALMREVVELLSVNKKEMQTNETKRQQREEEINKQIIKDVKETVHSQLRINEPIMTNIISDKIMEDLKEIMTSEQRINGAQILAKYNKREEIEEHSSEMSRENVRIINNTNLYRKQKERENPVRSEGKDICLRKIDETITSENVQLNARKDIEEKEKAYRERETEMIYRNKVINTTRNGVITNKNNNTQSEEDDRIKRERNLMVFWVKESEKLDAKERENDDMIFCTNLIKEGVKAEVEICKAIRIGKREENKVRPILLKLSNKFEKYLVLKRAKNLAQAKDIYKNTALAPDLTMKERNVNREYRRRQKTNDGDSLNEDGGNTDREYGALSLCQKERHQRYNEKRYQGYNEEGIISVNDLERNLGMFVVDKSSGAIPKRK